MEGDAGASQLNPTDADDASDRTLEVSEESAQVSEDVTDNEVTAPAPGAVDPEAAAQASRPSRVGRGWLVGVCAVLLVLSAGIAAGGYFALRAHSASVTVQRNNAAAMKAAKDCVSATQAPDTAAMAASEQKIIECATGDFGAQAALYSGVLADAYQASNAQVQVSDMRAAVERNNADGSVDVLVAVRVKITNAVSANQEQGYRLRVNMVQVDGQYKIAKLDQVAS
jgi:Mce-associated membrane protein